MSRKKSKKSEKRMKQIIELIFVILFLGLGYFSPNIAENFKTSNIEQIENVASYNLSEIPQYAGEPYVVINNNIPYFKEEDYTTKSFEKYSKLDLEFGRCGVAFANICKEIMPADNEKREDITSVKPTGWRQKKYAGLVDGGYLYNRCHLIGWQLAGENDNELNLITGTRYMNVEGMLPFENKVADYLDEKANSKNHVLYRVTPIFEGNNLVASGVEMEAYSIEDKGSGICFNVYAYNVQPGIVINYKTGESWLEE